MPQRRAETIEPRDEPIAALEGGGPSAALRLLAYSDASFAGGAESMLGHVLAELDPAIEVSVLGVDPGVVEAIAARRPSARGVTVRPVRGKGDLRGIAEHVRAVRSLEPDLVHVNLQNPWASQYGILAAMVSSVPVVAAEHAVFETSSSLQRRIRRLMCRGLAAHVAASERSARAIERVIGLAEGSVAVIENGVPDVQADPLPRVAAGPVVGTLARFAQTKGLDVLLRALPMLDGVTCVLVGDGPERHRLEALAGRLGISDRVVLTGWTADARRHLPGFDLYVMSSRTEGGQSLAVIEAMLASRAVVAARVGGVPDAVEDGRTGLLVEPDDPPALAAAIAELLGDDERREAMGRRGRARALERFSVRRAASSYEALYRSVAEGGSRRSASAAPRSVPRPPRQGIGGSAGNAAAMARRGRGVHLLAYSDAGEVGGAELSLGNLVEALDAQYEVTILGVDSGVVEEIASRRSGAAHCTVPRVRGKLDLPRILEHLRAVRRLRPDVMHVNLFSPWEGQYGILAGVINRVPVVAVEQVVFESTSATQRRLRKLLCSRLAAHVAVGEVVARRIERAIGLSAGSVEAVHNGVPDVSVDPLPRPREGPVVGSLARFSRQKGLDVLLRALPSLPDVSCVLVGDGPERPALERLAAELGVADRVVMTGWVSEPRALIPGFDVLAVPSRFEGFPLAVVEAMLSGLPIVASGVDSIPEAVEHGRTGLLVPPDDPEALAAAISELLGDPERREEMGARARVRAREGFTSAAMARSYERLYERVLGQAGP